MTEMETPQPEPMPGQPVEPLPEPTVPTEEPEEEVPGEEEVPESETMGTVEAEADETVDDTESETYPSESASGVEE